MNSALKPGPSLPRIGFVVGLQAEARLLRGLGLPVAIGGGTAAGAGSVAETLAGQVAGLVSFGLAGGLDPVLRPGTLVVPRTVVDGSETWATDPALNAFLGGNTGHVLLGGGTVLATLSAKQEARVASGADAVDLESAAVARAAARHGLPFAVLRAVCDPAGSPLPLAATVALDGAGRIGALRVGWAAVSRFWQIPALLRLARDAGLARRALQLRVDDLLTRAGERR